MSSYFANRPIMSRLAVLNALLTNTKLGQHRWGIERTIAWLFGYRRLTVRYERYGTLFCGFLTLAAALTCYKKLTK